MAFGELEGRDHARAVAGVDAGLLDVLHDAADDDVPARVGERVHVDLGRVLEELVDEDRVLGRRLDRVPHVAIERRRCRTRWPSRGRRARRTDARPPGIRSRRRPPALPPATWRCRWRPAECRGPRGAAQTARGLRRDRSSRATCRESARRPPEAAAPASTASGRRTARRTPRRRRPIFPLDDREHVLEGQRLEVEPIHRVVVGGDRLRDCSSPSRSRSRGRAARMPHDSSSSRTRCPARSGSVRCRE